MGSANSASIQSEIQLPSKQIANLATLQIGSGRVEQREAIYRLSIAATDGRSYHDAQLYDYADGKFKLRAPLQMSLRARFSHNSDQLRGTAGFGFWSQPVMPGQRLPRLPRQVWFFFGSAPGNMQFALDVPGNGWKAATLDMTRPAFLLLAPFSPIGFLLMRNKTLYRKLWRIAQRTICVAENLINVDMREWHNYALDWQPHSATFKVDDQIVLKAPYSPRGSLGFVAWIDNQYAVVTPQGNLGMGLVSAGEEQWLEIGDLHLEPGALAPG